MGTIGWNADLFDTTGPSSLSGWFVVLIILLYVFFAWLTQSTEFGKRQNFLTNLFLLVFAPPLVVIVIIKLLK